MKKRNLAISQGKLRKSDNKSLVELANDLFRNPVHKINSSGMNGNAKKKIVEPNIEDYTNNAADEEMLLTEEQKELREDAWTSRKEILNYWNDFRDLNDDWAAIQQEYDRDEELEQLENDTLNYKLSEVTIDTEIENLPIILDGKSFIGSFDLMPLILSSLSTNQTIKQKPFDSNNFLTD